MSESTRKLSRANFERAEYFIRHKGRQLEQTLFDFHFRKGARDKTVEALSEFQNEDGGFGHALEPDLRTPLSSAVATCVALRELVTIGVPSSAPMVSKAVRYLLDTLDREHGRWAIAPKGLKESPHAPWWGADDIVQAFRGCIANPTAEIIGRLLVYQDRVPTETMKDLLEKSKRHLARVDRTSDAFTMHDLICYLRLADSKPLDPDVREEIEPHLIEAGESIMEKDRGKWTDYCARPVWLCTGPDSLLYERNKEAVQENLDFEIETQEADGSWSPFWNWGDYHAETWPRAKQEWSGHLTLNNLVRLKQFDRIADIS